MFSELRKFSRPMSSNLKQVPRPTIGLICVFGFLLGFGGFLFLPQLWPGGLGIGKDESVTTTTVETIEKDKQGKTVKKVTTTVHNEGKTLWDWLSLLGVPLSLAILGYFLEQQQQKRAEKLSEDADNEEVLQTYLERLSVLLHDRNLIALSNKSQSSTITPEEQELLDSSLDVIRAKTLSILKRFANDAERKTSVIQFLIETDLVCKSKLNLSEADLSGAKLQGAKLQGAILGEAKLQGALLFWANCQEAILLRAKLQGADLRRAELQGADLSGAELQGAKLQEAELQGAELQWADLKDIQWDSETVWPDKSAFANAKNIPKELEKQLGITP